MKGIVLCLACILTAFFSCRKESRCDCLKSAGANERRMVDLNAFHTLHLEDRIQVTIIEDSMYRMVISAGKNLLPLINYSVVDSVLSISNHNKCNWMRSYDDKIEVELHTPSLKEIDQWGSEPIMAKDTLHAYEFSINIHNSGDVHVVIDAVLSHCNIHVSTGDIYVKGRSRESYIFNSGNGFVYAGELISDDTFMNTLETGDCYVSVSKWLVAENHGSGNIYYAGHPSKLDQIIKGKGKLISLD